MTSDADAFSIRLLEEAKRFLEKADLVGGDEQDAYLHGALMVGFSALESHVNGIADELSARHHSDLLASSLLLEKQVKLVKGQWQLASSDQYFRLEDRISFLLRTYAQRDAASYVWWSELMSGVRVRNSLVHPREAVQIKSSEVERFLRAIIAALNDIYLGVFSKGHPSFNRGLQSTLTF